MASSAETDPDKCQEEDLQERKRKDRTLTALYFNLCQAVVQHVMVVQADAALFVQAAGGDKAKAVSNLAVSTSLASVISVFVNQLGGKFSDAYGRKRMFELGPIVNILCGLTVYRNPSKLGVLVACRVAKLIATTLSGSIITNAAMTETVQGVELAAAGTKLQSYVGIAIVLAPFIESGIMKKTGSVGACYLGMAVASVIQLISSIVFIPETLKDPKPFDLQATLGALNPLGALNIFFCKNATLKKLVCIWMMIMGGEGKNTSDLGVSFMTYDLKMSPETLRNFFSFYGAVSTIAGLYTNPFFLKRMSPVNFTLVACSCVASGFGVWGTSSKQWHMFAGALPNLCGINGSAASAITPITRKMAIDEGFGIGEFQAWMSNLRAIPSFFVPLMNISVYNLLKKKGINPAYTWLNHALVTSVLPAILLQASVEKDKLVL